MATAAAATTGLLRSSGNGDNRRSRTQNGVIDGTYYVITCIFLFPLFPQKILARVYMLARAQSLVRRRQLAVIMSIYFCFPASEKYPFLPICLNFGSVLKARITFASDLLAAHPAAKMIFLAGFVCIVYEMCTIVTTGLVLLLLSDI